MESLINTYTHIHMLQNTYKDVCINTHNMGRMQIVLPDSLEEKLRRKAADKFGFKKGSISLAVKDAVEKWL